MSRKKAERAVLDRGERLERQRRNKSIIVIAGLFAVGLVTGFMVGHQEAESLFDGSASWPRPMAIGIAAAYLAAMVFGSIALKRQMDEVQINAQAKAGSFAAAVYVILYPIWFALWKGGLLPEPIHWLLFLLFWFSLAGSSLYYRYR